MDQLGDILRNARKKKGFTQIEVAEELGILQRRYNHYETNRSEPSIEILKRMVGFLDIGSEVYKLLTEQKVPHGDASSFVQVPGPEASLEELVIAQRELQSAAEKIDERIGEIIASKKGNASSGNSGNHDDKGIGPKKGKSGKVK